MIDLATERQNENSLPARERQVFSWRDLLIFTFIFVFGCLLVFKGLGRFPLFNPDEALYAEPAREMLETGQYITTLLNFAVRFTKPPLCIWAMACSFKLFGATEFAARFFGAACSVVLMSATYFFARAHFGTRAALIAAISLVSSPLYLGTAREAITDMPLSLFVAGALMSFYHGYSRQVHCWKWVGYALLGLAVMTKGPVGAALPAAILFCFHLTRRDLKLALAYYKPWFGAALIAVIAVPWFATEIYITKGAYFREFILRENLQRFVGVVDHKAPWWYHLPAMFGGFFPWTVFLPAALLRGVVRPLKQRSKVEAAVLLSVVWAVLTLVFFSASVSKLFTYTLPAFPALALLVGFSIDRALARNYAREMSIAFAVLALCYGVGQIFVPTVSHRLLDCPPALLGVIASALALELGVAAAAFVLSLIGRTRSATAIFISGTFIASLLFGEQALGIVAERWEEPIQSFAQYAAVSDWPILVFKVRKPSVIFYARRKILFPKGEKELTYLLRTHKSAYIIGRSKDQASLQSEPGCKIVKKSGQYLLVAWRKPDAVGVQAHRADGPVEPSGQ